MSVTTWGGALLELLDAAKVSQPALARQAFGEPKNAEDALRQRVMVHRYLHRKRDPSPDAVLAMNSAAQSLIGVEGIKVVLDAVAVLDNLIELDGAEVVDAAFVVLDHFEARGLLVGDWEKRFFAGVRDMPNRELRTLLIGIFLAAWQRLIDDIVGKTPRQPARTRIRAALSRHGLAELVSDPSPTEAGIDAFTETVRKELLVPPSTSEERLSAEHRLLRAAWDFASTVSGKSEFQIVMSNVSPSKKIERRMRGHQ